MAFRNNRSVAVTVWTHLGTLVCNTKNLYKNTIIFKPQCFESTIMAKKEKHNIDFVVYFAEWWFDNRGIDGTTFINFRTCLAWKGFKKTKRRRSTGQQPGTLLVQRIHRSSIARRVPWFVFIGCLVFVLPQKRPGRLSSVYWRARWTVVSAHRPAAVPPRPVPSHPPRPARSRPRPASPRPSPLWLHFAKYWFENCDIDGTTFIHEWRGPFVGDACRCMCG